MSYLSAITRLKLTGNLGGLVTILVSRKADITNIPKAVDGIVYGDITFVAGGGFIQWDVTTESAGIRGTGNNGPDGFSTNKGLEFRIPKMRGNIHAMLDQATDDEFIVLIKNANGKYFLFGTLDRPLQFTYDDSSGTRHADPNRYLCRFFYQGPNNIYEHNGDVAVAPAGPAPAIVYFNGVAIASLQPGETLNILSDYDFNEYFTTV